MTLLRWLLDLEEEELVGGRWMGVFLLNWMLLWDMNFRGAIALQHIPAPPFNPVFFVCVGRVCRLSVKSLF